MLHHNSPNPSPDLKEAIESGLIKSPNLCLDLGCGNGRNSAWLRATHLSSVIAIDKETIEPLILTDLFNYTEVTWVGGWNLENGLPFIKDNYVDLILLQFTLMFITPEKRKFLAEEITRVGCENAQLLFSWYDAKTSHGGNLRQEIDNYIQL